MFPILRVDVVCLSIVNGALTRWPLVRWLIARSIAARTAISWSAGNAESLGDSKVPLSNGEEKRQIEQFNNRT
jgi:hypothetical protein